MTLVEFIHPLKKGKQRDIVVAVLYFCKRYKNQTALTAAEIKAAVRQAKVPKASGWNVNAIITSTGGPLVAQSGSSESGALLFEITGTGEEHVRGLLDLPAAEPEVEHDVSALLKLAAKVNDDDVRDYIEEAIACLRAGALRAAVVFLWTGAIATLRDELWKHGTARIAPELKKYQPKSNFVKKDDFVYVKDVNLIEAAENLGRFDKGEKQIMQQALTVRNQCGHPGKYSVREKKVSSFIEDVVGIVFT